MKNLMLVSVIWFFGTTAIAQTKNEESKKETTKTISQAAKNAFLNEFPNASKVSWEAEDNMFEASFKLNNAETSATYDAEGKKKEVETEIEINQLPEAVIKYINKNHARAKLQEAAKIVDDKNNTTFEAEVSINRVVKDLIFDSDGNFIKEIAGD